MNQRFGSQLFRLVLVVFGSVGLMGCPGKETRSAAQGPSCGPESFLESQNSGGFTFGQLADLNQRIQILGHQQLGPISSRDRARIRGDMLELILGRASRFAQRLEAEGAAGMEALLRTDLREVLSAEVNGCLEEEVQAEGELMILGVSRDDGTHGLEYYLHGDEQDYHLFFTDTDDERLSTLESGDRIQVIGAHLPCSVVPGERDGSTLVVDPKVEGAVRVVAQQATVLSRTFGAQNTAVILVSFSDKTTGYTVSGAQSVVFDQTHRYMLENSYGQTWLTGKVFGPYTLSIKSTSCDSSAISTGARNAVTSSGQSLSGYTRFVYIFPKNACSWLGLGTIGGNPSHSWINASMVLHTVAHELGHNFGLYHARALECGSKGSIGVVGSGCSDLAYGDTTDIMGNKRPGHYNAFMKERLGWLGFGSSPAIQAVSSTGNYQLSPYSTSTTSAPKALKIHKSVSSSGARTHYYLEYRQPVGFDSTFKNVTSNLTNGIVTHQGSTSPLDSSYLLNMNPGGSWYQAALDWSKSFADSSAGVVFRAVSGSSSGATVSVEFPGQPVCDRNEPELSITPVQSPWVVPGTPVEYVLSVANRDSDACGSSSFGLSVSADPGFSGSFAPESVVVHPGAQATTRLTVRSPVGQAGGVYGFEIALSRVDGPVAATQAQYLVLASQGTTVAVISDRERYARGETIQARVEIARDGAALAHQPYRLVITGPGGAYRTVHGVTDAQGSGVHWLTVGDCLSPSAYRLEVHVDDSGAAALSEFEVL